MRLPLALSLWQAFKALVSSFALTCAAVGFAGGAAGGDVSVVRLPGPENVALAGAPKTDGCGAGAARQASADTHAGGDVTSSKHGS